MINPFVSVHMIAKENTVLGSVFLDAAFTSLHESQYPNEIVLVDNGSSDFVTDKLYDLWGKEFKSIGADFKIIKSDGKDFTVLRDLCLKHTNPHTDYIHWIDTDEVYYPDDLDILKNEVMANTVGVSQFYSYFYHFMINPFQIQDKITKDNIFAYNPNLHWTKGVHEKLEGLSDGIKVQTNCEYLHYGYVRSQWRTCLKWLHYDWIQHGHLNYYKVENCVEPDGSVVQKPWFRNWRDPNHVLKDRQEYCVNFPPTNPTITIRSTTNEMFDYECKTYTPSGHEMIIGPADNAASWQEHLDRLDSNEFWLKWQEKYKQHGTWADTLDWVTEEMTKDNWNSV